MRRQSRLHVLMILGQAGVGASRWCAPPIASFSPAGTLSLSLFPRPAAKRHKRYRSPRRIPMRSLRH